jgi:hypothetical protein
MRRQSIYPTRNIIYEAVKKTAIAPYTRGVAVIIKGIMLT